jgi:short subunit dehydrogenase-like uncharacterized protein
MTIAVYGATGATGRLVAAELLQAGRSCALVGRKRQRLEDVAVRLGVEPPLRVAAADDGPALRRALDGSTVLVNCASGVGELLAEAALDARVHYIDAAGDQGFIRALFERYGSRAEAAGVVLVPALGFDYAIGDCLAKLAAEDHEPLEEVVLAYALHGAGVSADAVAAPGDAGHGEEVLYADGRWQRVTAGVSRATFRFPPPLGPQSMTRYGSGEVVTVPRHTRTNRVVSLVTTSTWAPHPALAPLVPFVRPLAAAARRSWLGPPLRRAAGLPRRSVPGDATRRESRFTVAALAHGADGSRGRALGEGVDFDRVTVATLAAGARLLSEDGVRRTGVLSAAAAFDPARFLDGLRPQGLRWHRG